MTETVIGAETERLVRPLPDLAKTLSVRRLSETLVDLGHRPEAADAVANAVCDPTAVRRQLAQPGEMRVADGYLQVVYTSVWTFGVLPYPNNPRTLPAFAHPVAGKSARRRPLPRETDSADGSPELVLHAGRADLIGALDTEVDYLETHNPLQDSIADHGVREPVLLVPLRLTDDGGQTPPWTRSTLVAVDGSSRTAAAYKLLDVDPAAAVSRLIGNGRGIRQAVSDVLALSKRDASTLDLSDLHRLRSLVLPAVLIVGFTPDPGKPASLKAAIDSRLGSIHIEPPREWTPASRLDVQVDAVLAALVDDGAVDEAEGAWLTGDLTPGEAKSQGFSEIEDLRSARLLEVIDSHRGVSNAALKKFSTRRTIRPADRTAIAVEAAIRPFRSGLSEQRAASARSTLLAIWTMSLVGSRDRVPVFPTRRAADVVEDALAELDLVGTPGANCRRLLVLASYWLVKHNLIRKATRGGDKDRRAVTDVLDQMIRTEQGIYLLNRVVVDGRAGRVPQAVDADGHRLRTAADEPVIATEAWIRSTWPPATTDGDEAGADEPLPALPATPEAQLLQRRSSAASAIRSAGKFVADLDGPRHDGAHPLVRLQGLPPSFVDDLIAELTRMLGRLSAYRDVAVDAEAANADAAAADTEDAEDAADVDGGGYGGGLAAWE